VIDAGFGWLERQAERDLRVPFLRPHLRAAGRADSVSGTEKACQSRVLEGLRAHWMKKGDRLRSPLS
jgi:hypothetical protein